MTRGPSFTQKRQTLQDALRGVGDSNSGSDSSFAPGDAPGRGEPKLSSHWNDMSLPVENGLKLAEVVGKEGDRDIENDEGDSGLPLNELPDVSHVFR